MDEVVSYCWNDIEATEILYNKSIEALDFRRELSIKYNLDMMSFDSPKLGEKSFTFQLKEKLGDKVKWVGPVYGANKFELLAQHDFLILPSYDENFANVVIESLFVGIPVLVTENVGLSDYVKENNLGYVCERTKTGLVNLLFNAQKAKKMNVFKRSILNSVVVRDFEETALSTKYLDMYNSVIDN
jgi:glycosyltransferase involved in cell wall biosynthesis